METNFEVLAQAEGCYAALAKFRRDRERNKRYNYGDQWCDTIEVDGRRMTEEQYIISQGSVPLKNNLIRRLVRNVIGVYSSQSSEPQCIARDPAEKPLAELMTTLLRCNGELNRLPALYMRTLEEFLIGGLIAHRKWYGLRGGHSDCWTDYVPPSNLFVDANMRDFRSWDCSCVGELHDVTIDDVCRQFARSAADCRRLRAIYADASAPASVARAWQDFGYSSSSAISFSTPRTPGLCRVIEVWRRESRTRADASGRWQMEQVWHYYWLSPLGHVLAQGDSPYAHGSHPYVIKAYPMIDGEIHAFVSDVIDQQRYTNRLITMYDWMARASAKGVLMMPDDCVPPGGNATEMARAWSRLNGVMVYKPSASGEAPRQVNAQAGNLGISELLNMQLRFFEEISGVSSALGGRLNNSMMSAELYGQQTQQATAALLDVLGTFGEFVRDAAYVDASLIRQYYSRRKCELIAGPVPQMPDTLAGPELDLRMAPACASAASRQAEREMLMKIWQSGQISLDDMLRAGDFPFADALRSISN